MTDSSAQRRSLRVGTRGSKLARWQAEWVASRLIQFGYDVDIIEIATHGDTDAAAPISSFGGTGVFTKEIQRALLAAEVDLAVHSLKDLPTDPVAGLTLAAVPPRESVADVLVARVQTTLDQLAPGAHVGTGSLRRQAQLRHSRPDLRVSEIRGNVDTRLRKLDEGDFDAIVLAEAGLTRLGLANRITQVLSPQFFLPAVGQGALAIECRADDMATQAALVPLNDPTTHAAVAAERALLAHLRGGCLAPVGAWARIPDERRLFLSAVVLSSDGTKRLDTNHAAEFRDAAYAAEIGRHAAESLLAKGAAELISAARNG